MLRKIKTLSLPIAHIFILYFYIFRVQARTLYCLHSLRRIARIFFRYILILQCSFFYIGNIFCIYFACIPLFNIPTYVRTYIVLLEHLLNETKSKPYVSFPYIAWSFIFDRHSKKSKQNFKKRQNISGV